MRHDGFIRHRQIYVLIITVLLLLVTIHPEAMSQERVLSLREALENAMIQNNEIRALGEALSAQGEDIGIARSFILPKLVFEERFMRTNNPTYAFMAKLNQGRFTEQDFAIYALNSPEPTNDFQTSLSFEQALFAPRVHIAIDMAKRENTARGEEFSRKKEEIALRLVKTYLGVQTARAYTSVAERAIEDAREHLRIAETRYNSGLGLYSDVLRAKVFMSGAEERKLSAMKNLLVAKRSLGLMLGLSESLDVMDERPSFDLKTLEFYYSESLSRKDLRAMEERYNNAGNSLRMASAGYLPVFGIGGSYQLNSHNNPLGNEADSWQLSAFLRWDLFDGARREHEKKKAQHAMAETGEYLEGMKRQIAFAVYGAYLGVEEAGKGLELSKDALIFADEGRRLVKLRYENSLASMVDLLDVQTNLDQARAGVVEREAAYLTALAELGFQSGTLLRDLGIK